VELFYGRVDNLSAPIGFSRYIFDIDLTESIAKQIGVKANFTPVTYENRIDFILKNKIDIIVASMTHKVETEKIIDFSIDYFYDGQAILAKNGSNATSFKDFVGKKVGAIENTQHGKVFEVVQPLSELVYFKNYDDALQALSKGKIDAITGEFGILSVKAKKSANDFKTVGKPFTIEPYAIGLKENESNLRDALNNAIQTMVKNGEYEKLYKKWFGKVPSQKPILWP
jgi:polar amino acid transport system substrate-binding protein